MPTIIYAFRDDLLEVLFFCFLYIVMYILSIVSAIKKMIVKELKDFIFENCQQRMGFSKENSYYAKKHQKKTIYNCL